MLLFRVKHAKILSFFFSNYSALNNNLQAKMEDFVNHRTGSHKNISVFGTASTRGAAGHDGVFISTYIVRCRGAVREDRSCNGQSQPQDNQQFAVESGQRRCQDVAATSITLCTYCFRIKVSSCLVTWITPSDHG
jgi:hypothetical protein